jgi:excinuclease ABC subunit C
MARVRGVDPDDRAGIIAAIVAVLRREPAAVLAVREALVRRRDEAAAALAFELAARLLEEGEAVDWVVADQRATVAEPIDLEIYGWSGGVLVEVLIRAGRLTGWSQRSCGPEAAPEWLALTPPAWVEFARRNADLAARLATP